MPPYRKCSDGADLFRKWEKAHRIAVKRDNDRDWGYCNRALQEYRTHNASCGVCHIKNGKVKETA